MNDNKTRKGADTIRRRDVLRMGISTAAVALLGRSPVKAFAASESAFRVIETAKGKLRGRVVDGVVDFNGIRYGADTSGANRFLPPQPVPAWSGVRDALAFGNQCTQNNPDYAAWVDPSQASEDCLFLNVSSPVNARPGSRLPVMVWIHGGAYIFGSANSSLYNCHNIAKAGNVVTVGINHRLNIFGYTFLGEHEDRFATSGNAGHLDLIAALEWVRENIEAFGGDPANVTVFGESGGGGKICALLGMPAADGLFHRAIVQSGSLLDPLRTSDASVVTARMYATLGIRPGDIQAVQRLSTQELLRCYNQLVGMSEDWILQYGPLVDGRSIPKDPWDKSSPALARRIPMIIGTNLHEAVGFMGDEVFKDIPNDDVLAKRAAKFAILNKIDPNQVLPMLATYRRAMPLLSNRELLVRVASDIGFWKNAVRQAELQARDSSSKVYMYECHWKTPCFGSKWAPHGVEIPFIFNIEHYGVAWDGKDSDAARSLADPSNQRRKVGARMLDAWISFARTGNPSTSALAWSPYDLSTRHTMVFDELSQVVRDPRGTVRPQVLAL
ncbi:carboxylesterase family protein [Paraburkholderia phymatum]|uniref:Carboxylic ester hydrolase n=1 Tax=Paraburkholderia phymatum (strain DSM 17167 / CIP 108236 / LMG 21445 / STM815) TaxID=391038 RepID=B2JSF4_PARP8|nr:carboxylesterase family protein [Paraburkholderia phymatum]ACC73974.1 Carboxylesterase type B [Paraburkholderia phymatum STM815]